MARPKPQELLDLSDLALPGVRIEIRVTPNAARASLTRNGDVLRASVTVVPENGKANAAVRALLATAMGVAPTQLTLVRGHTSRNKVFVYSGGASRN